MRFIMLGVGGIGAGLYFVFKDFLPWLMARRTGVIRTRGYRPQTVRRDENPERFDSLSQRLLQGAGIGGMILIGSVAALAVGVASLFLVTAP